MIGLSRGLWIAVALILVAYAGLTIWLGVTGIAYPYQLDYGEGIVLWFAQQLAHGQPIYKSLTVFPYASSNYPPLAMLLSALLMPFLGEGYTGGRLLNFAALLIIAALIYHIARAEMKDRRVAALAAMLFMGSPYIYHWAPLDRVDLIGVAFSFGVICLVWESERTEKRRQALFFLILAAIGCLLALFTKHTFFAAPFAAVLAVSIRDRRQAIAFALIIGVLGGALYLVTDYWTAGGFSLGLIESNATIFLFDQLAAQWLDFLTLFPILLLLGGWSWFLRVRAKRLGVLEWYAVTAFGVTGLAGRMGAWENYFFEAIAIACVFAAFAIRRLLSAVDRPPTADRRPQGQVLVPLLLLGQLGLMWRDHDPRIAADLMAKNVPANQQLTPLLKQTSGTIISEDMGALATNGKTVAYYTFQYSMLARIGIWDQRWELNGLRDGLFPLVIIEHGTRQDVDHYRRFTREFMSALDRYYAPMQTFGKYEIYAPAPPLELVRADFGDVIGLVGWHVPLDPFQSGTLQLDLVWQAKRGIARRYTAFAQLLNAQGDKVAQDDQEPQHGDYPTTRWTVNEMVRDTYSLDLPGDLSPGRYSLVVGWYDPETGDRLEVPQSADNTVVLTTLVK